MATIRIGLFGLGTIGSGLYRLLSENGALLREREQADIDVVRVLVRDPGKARQADVPPVLLTTQAEDILGATPGVKFVKFSKEDVVRHPLVREILLSYEKWEGRGSGTCG